MSIAQLELLLAAQQSLRETNRVVTEVQVAQAFPMDHDTASALSQCRIALSIAAAKLSEIAEREIEGVTP